MQKRQPRKQRRKVMINNKTSGEPLFHISKRQELSKGKTVLFTLVAVAISLIIGALFCGIVSGNNPIYFFKHLFDGVFKTKRRIWTALRDLALLLGVSMALLPAFKMKFWNLGGNGQVLMGALAATVCMKFLGGKMPDGAVNIIMIVASIATGIVWALIPAFFKAFFKTNESLFTLMMNYIAVGIVSYFITKYSNSGSNTILPIKQGNLPNIGNEYMLTIIVVAVITLFMIIYFRFSKHGYEVSVVGESEKTAKYIGLNVKKIIMRTMALSGAICGIIGLLIVGSIDKTITVSSANNMGFTAIMVAWLANLNPVTMIVAATFITFVDKGMSTVRMQFNLTNSAMTNIVLGFIYFFVIAVQFFITYKINFSKKIGTSALKKNVKTAGNKEKSVNKNVGEDK